MRLPRVRFTVRRMMVAVAVAGVLTWGVRMWHSSARSRVLAARYHRRGASLARARFLGPWDPAEVERITKGRRPLILHYQQLARKYKRAGRYPWLPIAPDPPAPRY